MSIILPIKYHKSRIKPSTFIRGMFIFCFLGLVATPALVRADEWGCGNMTACLKKLEDKDPYIRRRAALDIRLYARRSKDDERKKVIAALKRHLQDIDKQVRYSAAGSIVDIDTTSKEVLPILFERLNDKTEDPIDAGLYLRHFGPEAKDAVPILIDGMKKEGISWFLGYPHSTYGDVLRDIGTPEALAAVEPLRRRELIADIFYAPFKLLLYPVFALLVSLCFAGLFWRGRAQYKEGKKIKYMPLLIPTLGWGSWGLYMVNKNVMEDYGSVLCFVSWFLFLITLAGLIPWLVSWVRVRTQEKRKTVNSIPS
ncbi:MAG: HEAT repeat domain-containing protein [Elusimicrobia bacterium]|nr:HEAT repeat domain-containing protein [Elusimicrobiota bacterium]